jgi:hypothetical protein
MSFLDDIQGDLGSALGDVESAAGSLISSQVQNVTIESSAFFPIEIDNPLAGAIGGSSGGGGGPASAPPLWTRLLRPRITVNTSLGQFVIAPGGPPPATPWLMFAVIGVALLAGYGAAVLLTGGKEEIVEHVGQG